MKSEEVKKGGFVKYIMIGFGIFVGFIILFIMFIYSIICSSMIGWMIKKCEDPQVKFDVMLEEEIPKLGEDMYELREGITSLDYIGENGEVTNPSSMGKITFKYNQGKDENGNQIVKEFSEYEGAIFLRSLMSVDDLALDSIELDDESIEERFGYTVEELLTTSTLGTTENPNASGEKTVNGGFGSHQEVVDKLSQKVFEVGEKYDVYPSILMAQIIEESGGGNSELAKNANNLLGIKADSNWKGEIYTKASKEGTNQVKTSNFKKYPNIEASIEDYGFRMQESSYMRDRYANVKRSANSTYQQALKNLAKNYATNPNYEKNILEIIEKYDLTKLDKGEYKKIEEQNLVEEEKKQAKKIEKEPKKEEEEEQKEKVEKLNTNPQPIGEDTSEKPKISNPLKGKTIVLDPGHGGKDGGATPFAQYPEKQFNLDIGLSMKSKLEALGATVLMTRASDTYPQNPDRPKVAIKNNADMFISIHANSAGNPTAQGSETLFGYGKDQKLAIEVQKHIISAWGLKDRGIKQRTDLAVLNGLATTSIPGILIEPGFMQDPNVFNSHFMNTEMKERLSLSVIAGVMSYYGIELTDEMKNILGEIPPSVAGESSAIGGVNDSHMATLQRKHNNFLTAWMMARKLEEEYAKHKEGSNSNIGHVFDDIIDGRADQLEFNRRDWLMTVQSEAYICFFMGDVSFRFGEVFKNKTIESFNRAPCKNLDDVYEETFGERIQFIPEQYQAMIGQTTTKQAASVICGDGSNPTNDVATGNPICDDGTAPTEIISVRKTLVHPDIGDIIGQFGLFTIYLPGVTVYEADDTYVEYLQERIMRDIYGLEYNITAVSLMTASGSCVDSSLTPGSKQVSDAVKQYAEPIKNELQKYGMPDKMPLLLAIMQEESGGKLSLDVMQASESLGMKANSIKDPQKSIEAGVSHFAKVYEKGQSKGVDLQTIIQSYNMGGGYIDHVAKNGGKHSEELAKQFSTQQMEKNPGVYKCAETNFRYPYCYGNFTYVSKVMEFINTTDAESMGNNTGTMENPCMPSSDGTTVTGDGAAMGQEVFQKIFQSAQKYKGTPYRYGGTDPLRGIDCSAFMQVIFKEGAGITLPRTAQTQYNSSQKIDASKLTPGDLIFFHTVAGKQVGHVGMYIGDGKMYHSGSSHGVEITKIDNGYWKERIVGYGRY